jgi:hypothetical protein
VLLVGAACLADQASFSKLCSANRLRFVQPKGYVFMPPPENCQYAMKSGSNVVVYFVRPGAGKTKSYNSLLVQLATTASGLPKDKLELHAFPPADVKAEFGADAGSFTFFPNPGGHGATLLAVLHRADGADFCVYFMSKDAQSVDAMVQDQSVFRALVFATSK